MSVFDVQGHRGARGLRPENSLSAFAEAFRLGVTSVELDVHLTKDDQLIVTHDNWVSPKLCRNPDGSRIRSFLGFGPFVRGTNLLDLQKLDCGSTSNQQTFPTPPRVNVPGSKMPTLQQVFDLAAATGHSRVRFSVEVKTIPVLESRDYIEKIVEAVVRTVRVNNLASRATIQCFDWRALAHSKSIAPEIRTAALLIGLQLKFCTGCTLNGISPTETTSLNLLRPARHYVDVYSPSWEMIDPDSNEYLGDTVQEIQQAGFPVIPWTPNSHEDLERVVDLGVDGVITDYPDRLIEILRTRGITVAR